MKALLAILVIFLVACTDREAEAPREEGQNTILLDAATRPMDRAAGVEDTLRDSAAERRRQIEEAEGR